jgi:hypothetical protein
MWSGGICFVQIKSKNWGIPRFRLLRYRFGTCTPKRGRRDDKRVLFKRAVYKCDCCAKVLIFAAHIPALWPMSSRVTNFAQKWAIIHK